MENETTECTLCECSKKLLTAYAESISTETEGTSVNGLCENNPDICNFASFVVTKMKCEKGECDQECDQECDTVCGEAGSCSA